MIEEKELISENSKKKMKSYKEDVKVILMLSFVKNHGIKYILRQKGNIK